MPPLRQRTSKGNSPKEEAPMNTIATTVTPSTPFTQNLEKPQQRQTAKEIIAANVKSLIEQLEAGHSDALTAYLDAMSRFRSYSFGNVLEIARQKPEASRVAGMYAWNQLGRRVKKGEKGIRILAPIIGIKRKKDEEAEKDITKQNTRVLVGFSNAYVFDRLSRDLRPARPVAARRRRVRMYSSIAVHGFLDCYAYLPCEAKFR
jgi:hypothetical protein